MNFSLTDDEKALIIECLDICKTICYKVGANEKGSKIYDLINKIYVNW